MRRLPFHLFLMGCCALLAAGSALAQQGEIPFRDAAIESGLDFVYFNGMTGRLYFAEMMGGGAAFLDYDGDGDQDVYVVQGSLLGDDTMDLAVKPARYPQPLTDRLYRNDSWTDATGILHLAFADVTASAGLPAGDFGMGVASADFDNDGYPDVYVNNFGSNRLLRNQGDGTFSDVTAESRTDDSRWSVAASFFDYDEDGWLDLFVTNYVDYRWATHRPCYSDTGVLDYCGPGAFDGVGDRLFRNLGDGRFEDVSRRSGIASQVGKGMGCVVGDFDGDERVDVFVTNDGERNFMWLNQGDGTFVDGALLAGTAVNADGLPEASMGVVFGDLDGDGLDDLFMSHLMSETNTLYTNDGGGLFTEGSQDSGLALPSWASTGFGIGLFDYDNDMDLDLFVANGAVLLLPERVRAGDPFPLRQNNLLFRNQGGGVFEDATGSAGAALGSEEVSRGVSVGDADNDGDSDLFVFNVAAPSQLLLNEIGDSNAWFGLVPRNGESGTMLGSRATLSLASGASHGRVVATDGSYASASDVRLLWGLADLRKVPQLEVRWASGAFSRFLDLPSSNYIVVESPSRER